MASSTLPTCKCNTHAGGGSAYHVTQGANGWEHEQGQHLFSCPAASTSSHLSDMHFKHFHSTMMVMHLMLALLLGYCAMQPAVML